MPLQFQSGLRCEEHWQQLVWRERWRSWESSYQQKQRLHMWNQETVTQNGAHGHMPRAINHCPWLGYQASWITGQKNLLLKPAVCQEQPEKLLQPWTRADTRTTQQQGGTTKQKAVAKISTSCSQSETENTHYHGPFMAYGNGVTWVNHGILETIYPDAFGIQEQVKSSLWITSGRIFRSFFTWSCRVIQHVKFLQCVPRMIKDRDLPQEAFCLGMGCAGA